jgi:hypothetical protein
MTLNTEDPGEGEYRDIMVRCEILLGFMNIIPQEYDCMFPLYFHELQEVNPGASEAFWMEYAKVQMEAAGIKSGTQKEALTNT